MGLAERGALRYTLPICSIQYLRFHRDGKEMSWLWWEMVFW